MANPEAERMWGLYLLAKAEFERIAHSGTVMSDEYEVARRQAKDALQAYRKVSASERPKT